jgi:hypothetical protein
LVEAQKVSVIKLHAESFDNFKLTTAEQEFLVFTATIHVVSAEQHLYREKPTLMAYDFALLTAAVLLIILITCTPTRPQLLYTLTICDFEAMMDNKQKSTTSYKGKNSNADKDPLFIVWNDMAIHAVEIYLLVRLEYFHRGKYTAGYRYP